MILAFLSFASLKVCLCGFAVFVFLPKPLAWHLKKFLCDLQKESNNHITSSTTRPCHGIGIVVIKIHHCTLRVSVPLHRHVSAFGAHHAHGDYAQPTRCLPKELELIRHSRLV